MKFAIEKSGDGWELTAVPEVEGESATTAEVALMLMDLLRLVLSRALPQSKPKIMLPTEMTVPNSRRQNHG